MLWTFPQSVFTPALRTTSFPTPEPMLQPPLALPSVGGVRLDQRLPCSVPRCLLSITTHAQAPFPAIQHLEFVVAQARAFHKLLG